jgi:hypothetical protein
VEPSALLLRPFFGLVYQLKMIDSEDFREISGINDWQRDQKPSEVNCSNAALSATNPT